MNFFLFYLMLNIFVKTFQKCSYTLSSHEAVRTLICYSYIYLLIIMDTNDNFKKQIYYSIMINRNNNSPLLFVRQIP